MRAKSILKARTFEQLFDLLQQDRVDIVLFEKLMGIYQLKQRALTEVALIELPTDPIKTYPYFHKKHAAYRCPQPVQRQRRLTMAL